MPYLRECTDDLNSTSRVMRKFLDDNPHIFYGPEASVDADLLKEQFLTWKVEQGIKTNTPGKLLRNQIHSSSPVSMPLHLASIATGAKPPIAGLLEHSHSASLMSVRMHLAGRAFHAALLCLILINVQDRTMSGTTRPSRMRSVLPSVGCGRSGMRTYPSTRRTPAA